mgnify:CR=1 FL=1
MIKIRLTRVGRKGIPFYHIVAADHHRARDGKFIEKLGYYNPLLAEVAQQVVVDVAATNTWLNKGAQLSARLQKLFLANPAIGTAQQRQVWDKALKVSIKGVQATKAAIAAREAKKAAREAAQAAAEAAPAEAPAQ